MVWRIFRIFAADYFQTIWRKLNLKRCGVRVIRKTDDVKR